MSPLAPIPVANPCVWGSLPVAIIGGRYNKASTKSPDFSGIASDHQARFLIENLNLLHSPWIGVRKWGTLNNAKQRNG